MLHKVNIKLFFPNPGDALALYNHAAGVIGQAITINTGELNEEISHIELEECGHDTDPQTPCVIIEEESTPSGRP